MATCSVILQKARFSPALDKTGKPMETYQAESVRWLLDN